MSKVKFVGTNVIVVSRPADLLKIYFRVYVDPLVMDETGQLIQQPGTYPVEDAINKYIINLPFDGNLSVTDLTDAVQTAEGVINPVFESAQAKYGTVSYSEIIDYYNANSGYLQIDPAEPLSSTITYINR